MMAVTSVTVLDHSGSVAISDKIVRSYTVVYQVICDDQNDGPVTCMLSSQMPGISSYYSVGNNTDTAATFKGYDSIIRRNAESQLPVWLCTAKFDTDAQRSDREIFDDTSPLDERAKWNGSFFTAQKAADRWGDDTPIVNSADTPMNIDVDDSRPTIVVSKNLATLDLTDVYTYRDSVNSSAFWGFGAFELKLSNFSWSVAFHNGVIYYPITAEIHVDLDGWKIDFIDEGVSEVIAGVRRSILGDDTLPVREPKLLDGTGRASPEGDPPTLFPNPKKSPYKTKDFSGLGLPSTLFGA